MYKKVVDKINCSDYPNYEFWRDKLRVTEQIEQNIKNIEYKKIYINEILQIEHMPQLMYEWLKTQEIDIENDFEKIKDKLIDFIDDKKIESLIYLKYYLKRKRRNVKRKLIKDLLIEDADQEILEELEDEFYIALLVLLNNYQHLLYYFLLNKAEQVSYNQYKLRFDKEKVNSQRNQILENELDFKRINDRKFLQESLNEFETIIDENKKSKLLDYKFENDRVKLYIQRDIGTGSIYEQERTIIGEETKIFILEFIENGLYILERSFEDKGRKIASFLIEKICSKNVSYIECKKEINIDLFEKFIKVLLKDEDIKINLRHLVFNNFEVKNFPKFSLKTKDKELSLAPSINELENRGFELLSYPEKYHNIDRIDINYRINDRDKYHIIPLYLEILDENKCFIQFSNKNLTNYKTNYFIEHMKERYDLDVTFRISQ